ncbi:hypothetical protein GQ53DRAFT_714806 [Thozetella sp. PMI_491]|nr:hypothetical protein GQ53DRAFT_714806 [Thozetella sp. PMI_491]
MSFLPNSYDSRDRYTEELCSFIATPLIRQITGGIHVNDALVYNAWEALPEEWATWWSLWPDHRLAQQDLIDSIDEDFVLESSDRKIQSQPAQSRPETLTTWLSTLRSLALPRCQREGSTVPLPGVLRDRMKTKKIAEISRAVAYIQDICQSRNITHIVDMGSGQGYLSVSLAYLFPQLRVLAIDGSKSQVAGSQAFAASLGLSESRLRHVVHWIDGTSTLDTMIEEWAGPEKCMLVGLHACGSLAEHMIRYFTTVPSIVSLAAIGCCYNHIVARSASHPSGFPISLALRQHNVALSPTALMTGCQAPNNWEKRDTEAALPPEKSAFGKRRVYRAIMEKLLFDKGIKVDTDTRPAWGTRKGDLVDFTTFARRAMDCLAINYEKISTEELVAYEERYRKCEGQIAILWTLSVLCCKIVESVIALDRYWYLVEQSADQVDIVPIFDFKVSPRNLMIVAEKKDLELQRA